MRQSVTAGLASAALVGLIVTACQDQPMAPQGEDGSAPVDPSLILIDDTTSTMGLLIDSAEFQIDTSSTFQHYGRVLWEEGTQDAAVLVEVAVDIAHDGRSISARELIARGDTLGPILYYHTNGDLVYRRIDLQFYAEDGATAIWHDVVLSQTGQAVRMRDTDAAQTRREFLVNGDFVYSTGYNANNGPPPNPGCILQIGNVCYPAPPFDAANTSDTKPYGTVRIRVWEIADFSLSLSANVAELHPWIRYFQPNVTPPPFIQQGSLGEVATITATAAVDGMPVAGQQVDVRAEILPSGGHAHLTAPMDIGVAHLADLPGTSLPGDGKPVAGMFAQSGDTTTTISDATDGSGEIPFEFVAGFVSGDIDIIGSTVYNGIPYEDTLRVTVRVPDLVALDTDADVLANALIIGATPYHPTNSHYATTEFAANAQDMVVGEHRTVGAQDYYLQLNDASLPLGGAFTVEPPQTLTGARVEQPGMGHRAHALGVDEDISWCYALTNGVAGTRISGTDCAAAGTIPVDPSQLQDYGFVVLIEAGTEAHYHIRLEGQ